MRLDEFLQNQSNENPYEKYSDAEFKALGPQISIFYALLIEGEQPDYSRAELQWLEECQQRGIEPIEIFAPQIKSRINSDGKSPWGYVD